MKRIIFLLLLLPSLAWGQDYARMNPYVLGAGVSAAACSYVAKDAGTGDATGGTVGYSTTYYGKAVSFTSTSAYTAKKVMVRLNKSGSPTFDMKAYICTNNATGPKPDTCTAFDTTLNAADLSTSYGNKEFTSAAGYPISNGTRYWVAIMPDALGNGDSSNYVNIRISTSGTENLSAYNQTLPAWTAASDTSAEGYFTVYACE